MTIRRHLLTCVVAALAGGLLACATNPATGARVFNLLPESAEIALGKESDTQIRTEMGVYADQEWQAYVNDVGQAMAKASHRPALPWTFTVLDASAINAFALPGGYVYVTRGILPFLRDEAELANVIGHEIAHVTALHGARAYSRMVVAGAGVELGRVLLPSDRRVIADAAGAALGLLFLSHGRDAELEADRLGVGYAAGTGWNPSGMAGMLGTLGRLSEASDSSRGVPNFLSTHPLPEDRVTAIRAVAESVRTPTSTRTAADVFARRLDGVVFGDSREQGIVRGRDFVHPILRVALTFPDGWAVSNGASAVTARPEDGNAALLLQVLDTAGRSAEAAGRATLLEAGFEEQSSTAVTVGGQPGVIGVYRSTGDERYVVRALFVQAAGRAFMVAGVAPDTAFAGADPAFRQTLDSFRTLSQAQADAIQPARVDFRTARPGDTWKSLAKSLSGGAVSPSALAIMNGMLPATPPTPGTRLRVVIGG